MTLATAGLALHRGRQSSNPLLARRSSGVLLHLTSLDGPCAIGDLGACAHEFAQWCSSAGFAWWQMLPIGPIGPGNSPYASTSSFAGEPLLISLESLADLGLLSRADVRESNRAARTFAGKEMSARGPRARTNYDAARRSKEPAFLKAFEAFRIDGGSHTAAYRAFERRESAWLAGWRAFNNDTTGYHAFLQFEFDRQWRELRRTCAAVGVKLLGDIPIFVTLESADVAAHPELFRLDRRGRPEVLTGVPPDCFSKDGQLWGHPHYRWTAHRAEKFRWWIDRIAATLRRFDGARIDHFVGFHHAYEIPATAKTARRGRWRPQAGQALLTAAQKKLGSLPLLAEDLGAVTREVTRIRDAFGLPGMTVLQHAFGSDVSSPREDQRRSTVIYTGTHDNDTTQGWWRQLDAASRRRVVHAAGAESRRDPSGALLRLAFESQAQLAIIPVQDAIGLDRSARMNLPGSATGNWVWRLGSDWRGAKRRLAQRMRALARRCGRIG